MRGSYARCKGGGIFFRKVCVGVCGKTGRDVFFGFGLFYFMKEGWIF